MTHLMVDPVAMPSAKQEVSSISASILTALIKQNQNVFVSYDRSKLTATGDAPAIEGLVDLSDNFVSNFTQNIVNNSEQNNDQAPPVIDTSANNKPKIDADGKTFTLTFNESLNADDLTPADYTKNFKLFVDGADRGNAFDSNQTTYSENDKSITLVLNSAAIEKGGAGPHLLFAWSR